MRKYGIQHFQVVLIEETNNPEEREQYWIKQYNSYGATGYNATFGGDGKKYIDYDFIVELYLQNGRNAKRVHEITGYDESYISKIVRSQGILTKSLRKIGQYNKDTNELIAIYSSQVEAAEKVLNKYKASGISACLNGKQKTAYGYKWQYIDV